MFIKINLITSQSEISMISIGIPAVVAILVVLLTQYLISERAKKELLIRKVEELFLASTDYAKCCTNILIWIEKNRAYSSETKPDIPDKLFLELTESINKMDMICGLYFKQQNFKAEDYFVTEMPIIDIVKNNIEIEEIRWNKEFNTSNQHKRNSSIKLYSLCEKLMKKYGH